MAEAHSIPVLANGVRLRKLDEGRSVLLVPEGVVNLNPSAAAALELLDGVRSCGTIATELSSRYSTPSPTIAADVGELLDRLAARGWVFFSSGRPAP